MGFFTPQDITNSVFKAVLHIISNSSFFFLFCIQNTVLSVSFRGALYSSVNKDNVKEWNVQMLSFERVLCFVTQLCPTLCDPMDCSPPGSSVHGDSPGKNTGVGYHALLQGIFPTQGSNPGLLNCRQTLWAWATREALAQSSDLNTYLSNVEGGMIMFCH